ncbi:uncharacterized protein [Procambarus clarkii]|uniref:uncharacterized protein n=1 Tax=Procambarus clarkii TaxID=6728 RepID=UPI001E676761|nr:uncharacterized protein LOC123775102 [Procambarus clarkii]
MALMKRQLSTALSDFVLALSAVWGFRMLHEDSHSEHQFGKWWFMLVTMAATLGVVRFAALLPSYRASVLRYHTNFSWLCRAIGIPCLAAEICRTYKYSTASQLFLLSAVTTFITSSLKSRHKDQLTDVVSTASVSAILGLSVIGGNMMHAAAAVFFIISGLVGSEGDIQLVNLPRVDVLHYMLVAVNYCLVWGFM